MNTQIHTAGTTDQSKNADTAENGLPLDALISNALELHRSQLHQKLSFMFDYADESLIALVEAAQPDNTADDETESESDQKNGFYEKLIHTLQSERDNIENAFFAAINKNTTGDRTQNGEPSSKNGLSLVDQDEMDEMVAVAAIYTNAMNQYGEEVNNLTTRFEYLEMSSSRTLPKHIFDLRHICEAFQSALEQVEFSTRDKLLLFKLFDRDVGSQLGDMYKSLNQLFIDADILPEVVYSVKSQGSTPHSTKQQGQDETGESHDATSQFDASGHASAEDDSGDTTSDKGVTGSLNAISRFVSQFMSGFGIAKGEGIPKSFSADPSEMDSNNCYSQDDLIGSLTKMQNNLANTDINDTSVVDAEKIKRDIIANMSRSHGGAITKSVHTLDQRRIDLVAMIFSAIADDENISMIIANLLMHLQIPIIKTAMVDESLFTDQSHPARVTLDLITRAGKGVSEDTDRVYLELKQIVNGILKDYDIDTASFETAVVQLNKLIEKEDEALAENEKNEQREVIKKHARNVVLGEMRLITKHKIIPENVRPLMLKHWPSLMFSQYIDHGIESSEWFLSVKIYGLMMEFLQPVKDRRQWQKLNQDHHALLDTVGEELQKAHKSSTEIDAQIAELQQTFSTMLDAGRDQFEHEPGEEEIDQLSGSMAADETGGQAMAIEEHAANSHDDKAAQIEEQVRIAQEKIAKLPSGLHPGVWFEVFDGDDKPVRRLKLSVILADAAKLIFVDRQGMKVIEKDAEEFVNDLDSGHSKLIADHSTFEHALGSVIHTFSA